LYRSSGFHLFARLASRLLVLGDVCATGGPCWRAGRDGRFGMVDVRGGRTVRAHPAYCAAHGMAFAAPDRATTASGAPVRERTGRQQDAAWLRCLQLRLALLSSLPSLPLRSTGLYRSFLPPAGCPHATILCPLPSLYPTVIILPSVAGFNGTPLLRMTLFYM